MYVYARDDTAMKRGGKREYVTVGNGVGEATVWGMGWRRCRVAGWLEYPAVCTTEQSVEACPGREKSVDQPIR